MTVCQGNRALNLAPSELFFHGYFKVLYASSFYTRGLARRPPRVRRNPPSRSTPPHLRARLRSAGTCGWQAFQWRAGPGIRGFDKAEAVETYLYVHPPAHPLTQPHTLCCVSGPGPAGWPWPASASTARRDRRPGAVGAARQLRSARRHPPQPPLRLPPQNAAGTSK